AWEGVNILLYVARVKVSRSARPADGGLLDVLVCSDQHRRRDFYPEGLGSLQVDDKLENGCRIRRRASLSVASYPARLSHRRDPWGVAPGIRQSGCPVLVAPAAALLQVVVPDGHAVAGRDRQTADLEVRLAMARDAAGHPLDALADDLAVAIHGHGEDAERQGELAVVARDVAIDEARAPRLCLHLPLDGILPLPPRREGVILGLLGERIAGEGAG